jgi:hypothetical protein
VDTPPRADEESLTQSRNGAKKPGKAVEKWWVIQSGDPHFGLLDKDWLTSMSATQSPSCLPLLCVFAPLRRVF